ncbi:hypothetical protein KAFR_0B04940 [Kazachstania africana CBS 2517]|uniref:DNA 3'-phosphatase n=1 Tax=Kazachstania africana (strain ATCC 22294 / BCRC 22015 / CBS 2517 / CECT 1963 / NBRC 1671 / NRRL Y-8276) TaxID=1071382 RepID=H2AQZ0_KAZAF|nr:hypothetical protein KAFR_0B04940 [Kazachstania africana CBS 2517]CCF56790.1 hypothetical protein KAFR_0B04940 [Kazachstania africana CBS 2517]
MSHKETVLPYLIKYTPKNRIEDYQAANVYSFDLDGTIIGTKTNSKFSRAPEDWKFLSFGESLTTLERLIEIVQKDSKAQIVIFSNQGGVLTVPPTSKSCINFTTKVKLILEAIAVNKGGHELLKRLWIYAAPKMPASLFPKNKKATFSKISKPIKSPTKIPASVLPSTFESMRKPQTGMIDEFKADFKRLYGDPMPQNELNWVYYCGDAGGRPSDFSDSDKYFAKNANLGFKFPEDVLK